MALTAEEYQRARERDALAPLLPFLEEELAKTEKAQLTAAYLAIGKRELTAEQALVVLLQMKERADLLRKLRQRLGVVPGEAA